MIAPTHEHISGGCRLQQYEYSSPESVYFTVHSQPCHRTGRLKRLTMSRLFDRLETNTSDLQKRACCSWTMPPGSSI